MTTKTFIKRPIAVEAWQVPAGYAPGSDHERPDWVAKASHWRRDDVNSRLVLCITSPAPGGRTVEAKAGDWIVKAPTGCIYPIDKETFERNYLEDSEEGLEDGLGAAALGLTEGNSKLTLPTLTEAIAKLSAGLSLVVLLTGRARAEKHFPELFGLAGRAALLATK